MKEFCCWDVVPGCTTKFRAETNDGILAAVAQHARAVHGLTSVPPELVTQVVARIRDAA